MTKSNHSHPPARPVSDEELQQRLRKLDADLVRLRAARSAAPVKAARPEAATTAPVKRARVTAVSTRRRAGTFADFIGVPPAHGGPRWPTLSAWRQAAVTALLLPVIAQLLWRIVAALIATVPFSNPTPADFSAAANTVLGGAITLSLALLGLAMLRGGGPLRSGAAWAFVLIGVVPYQVYTSQAGMDPFTPPSLLPLFTGAPLVNSPWPAVIFVVAATFTGAVAAERIDRSMYYRRRGVQPQRP